MKSGSDSKRGSLQSAHSGRRRDLSRKRKLAYLLALEVRRIVDDLEWRKWLLLQVWTKMRTRQPLLNVLRSRYEAIKPDDLLMLPVECIELADKFYKLLDELRFYLETTEDMPTELEVSYERFRLSLARLSGPLLKALDKSHAYKDAFPLLLPRGGDLLDEDESS